MGDKFFYAEKVSEIVTEKILKQLKQGIIPWRQSWKDAIPRNWETNRPYNGINLFLLAPGEYLTFNQIKKLNARLKKGAKGYLVVFWKVDTIKAEKKMTLQSQKKRKQ
ncbi:ArdC family protein [Caldicellulosiruptor danielii]|uniref:ArdC family protein n=1 Tax=Anaerocellum danielii TaxID=1387557 RepID=A0ABZ0U355_9FIRM|nr:ArdC family protein [Caldicellulosiruptor danielii]WPX08120.1 ArdC family protein [Caldicellulosiruptor danielii]